jgi:hypothetical protein
LPRRSSIPPGSAAIRSNGYGDGLLALACSLGQKVIGVGIAFDGHRELPRCQFGHGSSFGEPLRIEQR